EFYYIAGWNKAKRQEEAWKKASPALQVILDHMPSAKTASTDVFDIFIVYALRHYKELVQFYDERWRKLGFQRYRVREKALAEVCRRFTTNNKKYGEPAARSTVEQVAGDGPKEDVGSDKSRSLTASREKRMWPSLPSLPLSLEEMAGASESNPHDA